MTLFEMERKQHNRKQHLAKLYEQRETLAKEIARVEADVEKYDKRIDRKARVEGRKPQFR